MSEPCCTDRCIAGRSKYPDETPYPSVIQHPDDPNRRWLKLSKQDNGAPPGEFAMCRQVLVGSGVMPFTLNLSVGGFRTPPREWPACHASDFGAGYSLTVEEAIALRDVLDAWIGDQLLRALGAPHSAAHEER